MRLSFTPLPPYKSKPGTERFQFLFNGVKIPVERCPKGIWKCWIDILRADQHIELSTLDQPQAEEALGKLLMLHFLPVINMLKEPPSVPSAHVG